MKTEPKIRTLSDAIGAEVSAEKQLGEARAQRQAAEQLQTEWQEKFRDFRHIKRSHHVAATEPLDYVAARDREEFGGNEIIVIRNFLAMQKSIGAFQDGIFLSLGFTPSDGTDESLFGPITRTKAVIESLAVSAKFLALKARAETFAASRADELLQSLKTRAAEIAAWGETHGAPADELAEVRAHL